MRVETARQPTPVNRDFSEEIVRAQDEADAPAQSRALVVTEVAEAQPSVVYRQATFLAHLIATKEHAPQTRERRRADPAVAISAYRTVAALAG
jgi:hypothetical protein